MPGAPKQPASPYGRPAKPKPKGRRKPKAAAAAAPTSGRSLKTVRKENAALEGKGEQLMRRIKLLERMERQSAEQLEQSKRISEEIVLLKQALAKSDPPPSPASRKEMEQALKLLCTQARQIIGGEGFGLAA